MLVLIWFACFCAVVPKLGHSLPGDTVFLTIPQGSLVGTNEISILHNKSYYSFRGIPYAKPMLGKNKFDPPRPPEPWQGLWNSTVYAESCSQFNRIFDTLEGTEDCLYLNVYTPSVTSDTCKPVMVYIYGGGFNFGATTYDYYGGDYLMERDVVVVTPNYRLGAIGFLCTGDKYAPGNAGLKDQVYALRWIRNNIKYFGGCPNKVTIMGHDAGAISVGFHLLSPMSRGLFHRAIIQSGSPTEYWAYQLNPKEPLIEVARALGIHSTDSKTLIESLKKVPTPELIRTAAKFLNRGKDMPNLNFYFLPCIETPVEGEEVFLPDNPMNMLKSGDLADVPLIIGTTEDEGAWAFTTVFNVTQYIKGDNYTLREKWAVREPLGITDSKKRAEIYKDILRFYFGSTPMAKYTIEQMKPMVSDVLYDVHMHILATIYNERMQSNVYRYLFIYRSDDALLRPFAAVGNVSSHGDELEYLFFSDALSTIPEPNTNPYTMNRLMTKMWTNFARDGDPTSSMDEYVTTKWDPMGKENNILYIDLKPEMKNEYFPERMAFWMEKYKHLLGKFVNILT